MEKHYQKTRKGPGVVCCLYITILVSLLFPSCSRLELTEQGHYLLQTDWEERTEGISIPSSYQVILDGKVHSFGQGQADLPELFPGTYPYLAYNLASGFDIESGIAKQHIENGQLVPMPEWLFSATGELQYANESNLEATAIMQQQVRQLTIILEPEGGSVASISSIQAQLSGIASAWDLQSNVPSGSSSSVPLEFKKQADGTWKAVIRILGVQGEEQMISGTLGFDQGIPEDVSMESDMTELLADANTDKHIPMELKAKVETQTAAGFKVSIKDWVKQNASGQAW